MEFLFTVEWASTEAILVLICVGIFAAVFAYDGYIFLRRFFHVLTPTKEIPSENSITTETLPPQEERIIEPVEDVLTIEQEILPSDSIQEQEEKLSRNSDTPPEILSQTTEEDQIIPETISPIVSEEVVQEHLEELPKELVQDMNGDENISLLVGENDNFTGDGSIENATLSPEETIQSPPEEELSENTPEALSEEKETIEEEVITELKQEEIEDTIEITSDRVDEEVNPTPAEYVAEPKNNHTETLFGLINSIRTLIARGQTLEARGLIIQGLALEKDNKELNMMLAGLYEQDRHFEKAEYIYKDLALLYPNDIEILEKLGNVLIIERRYEIALEMYKKILSLSGETEGTLYILAHLSNELGQHEMTYMYGKKYQKQWPNNPEILTLISTAEIALGKRQDAIQTLIKLKNLTPYNHEVSEMIQKLIMEEELANNFNSTNPQ